MLVFDYLYIGTHRPASKVHDEILGIVEAAYDAIVQKEKIVYTQGDIEDRSGVVWSRLNDYDDAALNQFSFDKFEEMAYSYFPDIMDTLGNEIRVFSQNGKIA